MKTIKLFVLLFLTAILFISALPVAAAPPADNPGKGPPELDRVVFIHYGKDFAPGKPSGTPGKGPGNKDKGNDLYSYSGIHWVDSDIIPDGVPYYYNPANEPGNFSSAIQASFQTWENDPESYIDFWYEGTTTDAPGIGASRPDYNNVVGWADLSAQYPDAIGITIVWSLRGRRLIVDCDTVLNSASYFAWTQYEGAGDPNETWLPGYNDDTFFDVDVQNIMTHEAGHWLMLNDLYDDTASEQTMFGYALDGELKSRSLETGDMDGVRKIYVGATK